MTFQKGQKPTHGFKKGHKVNVGRPSKLKGRKRSEFSGKNNPMFGVHRFGENSPHWKGEIIRQDGRKLIYVSNHPFRSKQNYVLRSRLVMEQIIGRYLRPEEVVHHKGTKYPIDSFENKQDDRPENLQLFDSKSEHTKFHASLRK